MMRSVRVAMYLVAVAVGLGLALAGSGCGEDTTKLLKHPSDLPDHCDYHYECPLGYVCNTAENKCVPLLECECQSDDDCQYPKVCRDCFCVPPNTTSDGDRDLPQPDGDELDPDQDSEQESEPDSELDPDQDPQSETETDESAPVICLPGKEICRDGLYGPLYRCNETGTAWLEIPCDEGQVCVEDHCEQQVCEPFEVAGCVDEYRIERCNDTGTGWIVELCGANIRCENDQCVAVSCEPGVGHRCFGRDTIERCSPTGDSYVIEECPEGTFCDTDENGIAECMQVICEPNSVQCNGNVVEFCNALGTQWIEAIDCSELNAFCDEGSCKPRICTPGITSCSPDNTAVQMCNETGTSWKTHQVCSDLDPEAECRAGECLDPCGLAAYDRSYQGCEFWAVDLDNHGSDQEAQTSQFAIVVSNTHSTRTAHVTVYTNSGVAQGKLNSPENATQALQNIAVPPLSLVAFLLPDNHVVATGRGFIAYKVVSDLPISAYQFNPYTNQLVHTNDATLLLPKHALGKQYRQLSNPHQVIEFCSCGLWCDHSVFQNREYIAIIATEPNTTITFAYTGATLNGAQSITLNPFEVYLVGTADGNECRGGCSGLFTDWQTGCWRETISGTLITSNKPISVFGAHQCTFLPQDQWACDHLEHQLFPIETWGKEFVATATSKRRQEPDWYRIVANEDNTTVHFSPPVNGQSTITLNAGEVYTYTTNQGGGMSHHTISADKPIMVGQFLSGQDSTGLGQDAEAGDPAFFLLAPNEQFRRDYVFLIPSTYAHDFVNIVAPPDTTITIDGGAYTLNSNNFTPVGDWRVTVINYLDDGTHKIIADKPIGIYVYGYSRYVSYGYTGGLDLRLINIKEK